MYFLKILRTFAAAHRLDNYQGKCESLHGHNWKVEVVVKGSKPDSIGLVIDFKKLKEITDDVLNLFDHKNLNEIKELKGVNPSSEHLSYFIYTQLKKRLKKNRVKIFEVGVWESEGCAAFYREEK
jgi:6-pyruvoyltetrahydropterin/6-carboxytetrahydropterin synthase